MRQFPRVRLICLPVLVCLALAPLAGCESMGLDIPNPFATTRDVNDVYFSQFPDVPIPADMKSVPKNSLVTPTQEGVKMGLETFGGRVEAASLSNAMIHNMTRQGWSLRGSITGKRTMQLHEKDQRYVILYIYDQTMDTAMEVWMLNRLADGGSFGLSPASSFVPMAPASNAGTLPAGSAATPYSPPASTATEQWESGPGGSSSQKLGQ